MPEDTDNEPNIDSDDDYSTQSTRTRWEWTGTILAIAVVLSLPIAVLFAAFGVLSLGAVSTGWFALYSTVALMAAVWVFGEETLKAVSEYRKE